MASMHYSAAGTRKKLLAAGWFAAMFILLTLFLLPVKLFLISIYTLPAIFVLFTSGIFLIGPVLITLLWSFSLLLLLGNTDSFLPTEKTAFYWRLCCLALSHLRFQCVL